MKPHSSQIQPPGLYIVATPIGNLQDITYRALEFLKRADVVVCEDTRVTGKLLSAYGLSKPCLSYNDHNAADRRPQIMGILREGKHVALVSDAGTPLISDPGYKLVCEALEDNIYVTTLPGASSVLAAVCLSGLPSDRFFFAGFLPTKKEALKKEITALKNIPSTLLFLESAKRLAATLAALQDGLGDRPAAVLREMTKLYEEGQRGTLSQLQKHYEKQGVPKGEIVIVVSQPKEQSMGDGDIIPMLKKLLISHSVKEAASMVAEATGRSRKEIYSLALTLK